MTSKPPVAPCATPNVAFTPTCEDSHPVLLACDRVLLGFLHLGVARYLRVVDMKSAY
jgi:hypothetical protein